MNPEEFVRRGASAQKAVDETINLYKIGLIDGIRRFAWWKDGVQYVGTSGKTLAEAVAEIEVETKDGNYRQPY